MNNRPENRKAMFAFMCFEADYHRLHNSTQTLFRAVDRAVETDRLMLREFARREQVLQKNENERLCKAD